MWKLNCGCNPPYFGPIIFDIPEEKNIINNSKVKLPNNLCSENCLKLKIIKDFQNIINKLECGIQLDLKDILNNLSLLEVKKYKDICC